MSKIEVNQISSQCGSTLTIGQSGDTVTLASGATQTGFGRTGTVDWQTSSVKTSTFTAVSGEGYFVNTTGGAVTVNLPAGVAGAIVGLKDYAGTWQTNAVTLNPNGSDKIGGGNTIDPTLAVKGESVLLVFVDSTQGWLATSQSVTESPSGSELFICASGGTPSQFGDYEIRTFTSSGTFTVNSLATNSPNNVIDYVVVAGGGGGGSGTSGGAGGGGAGGYRSFTSQPVSIQVYPVTIGAGGGGAPPGVAPVPAGTQGSTSTFISNSSAGGGGGGSQGPGPHINGGSGGSGGGGAYDGGTGGAGNTPPVSPPQGNAGGAEASPGCNGGGGGGAGGAGASNTGITISPGGVGVDISTSYGPGVGVSGFVAGGGGGGGYCAAGGAGGNGGGGAGAGGSPSAGVASNGTANTGGGGGGATSLSGPPVGPSMVAGAGGSGIVIIRYKFQ
jgi:hypothetical protein